MPTPKAPATPTDETYYTVSGAAIRLGLRDPEENSKRGEWWLRQGVNLKDWPHHRMAGQLMFSETDLADIAAMCRNAPQGRTRHPRRSRTTVPAQRTSAA